MFFFFFFFFSSRRRHTRYWRDWSSDVCSSDLTPRAPGVSRDAGTAMVTGRSCRPVRSEEHTSELQSRQYLVCRLLLEKKIRCVTVLKRVLCGQELHTCRWNPSLLRGSLRGFVKRSVHLFFAYPAAANIYTLSLHDALPI